MYPRAVGNTLQDRVAHDESGSEVVKDRNAELFLRPSPAELVEGLAQVVVFIRHLVLGGNRGCPRNRWFRRRGRREDVERSVAGRTQGAADERRGDPTTSASADDVRKAVFSILGCDYVMDKFANITVNKNTTYWFYRSHRMP